ncbi:hypothetical protein [Lelliottia sp. WB101]|uniref:hypothetical protein n=1 Tax=Lelliottia sp. WB101 TaxID=2153385 RepID=UPI001F33C088|nr:hypothetical protein [Lelliottia sp. WB101]
MKAQHITPAQAKSRVITPDEMVSCNLAFIDCKLPGSHLKQNYSFIGPGVTQSSAQVVNIPEPHGFNIGAAAMPKGVTNNLHLHFTAEVFLIHEGTWRFRWGRTAKTRPSSARRPFCRFRRGFSVALPTLARKRPAAWSTRCLAGITPGGSSGIRPFWRRPANTGCI